MLGINKFKKAGVKISQFSTNHLTIESEYGVAFQSYDGVVAFEDYKTGKVYLGKHWDYSRTTMKYLSKWLGANAKEIRNRLETGVYTLDEEL